MNTTTKTLGVIFALALTLSANAWTIRPGLQQAKYSMDAAGYSIDWVPAYELAFSDPTRPLDVVPGTVMADVQNSESNGRFSANYTSPYSGAVYHWDLGERQGPGVYAVTAYAYRGDVFLEEGKTYGFGKRFSDYAQIMIGEDEVLCGRHQTEFTTATYSPKVTGWYPFKVMLVADNDYDGDPSPHQNKGPFDGGIGSTRGVACLSL